MARRPLRKCRFQILWRIRRKYGIDVTYTSSSYYTSAIVSMEGGAVTKLQISELLNYPISQFLSHCSILYSFTAFPRSTMRASSSARSRVISPSLAIPVKAIARARRAVWFVE